MRAYRHTQSPTLELFSGDQIDGHDRITENLPVADIYHLHWINRAIDLTGFVKALPARRPLVWTLHDMNPFTGGCHYSLGCEKYMDGCGACPLLGSSDEQDVSAEILARKKNALDQLSVETTRIIAPSRWLKKCAERSALLGRFEVTLLPNGVDCNVFRPRPQEVVRDELGLPANDAIVLFVADSGANHRKGFDLFMKAADGLRLDRPITFVSVGADIPAFKDSSSHVGLGRVDGIESMAKIYAAADVFVTPVREENLATVVLEAMACGTPVVGFDVGGIPDMVRPGETGLLAPAGDVAALRAAIETVLADETLRERISLEARRVALEEYTAELQTERLVTLYNNLQDVSRG